MLETATPTKEKQQNAHNEGPVDALDSGNDEEVQKESDKAKCSVNAAVLDESTDRIAPLQMWDDAVKNMHLMETCIKKMQKLQKDKSTHDEARANEEETLRATLTAVKNIQKMTKQEVLDTLHRFDTDQ